MWESLNRLFNWKKYPASVFFLAIPLFMIGMSLMGTIAYLAWVAGDKTYAWILLAGIGLLIFALWPLRHQIRNSITSSGQL
jgi:uncharacterized membrane protein YqjE